MLNVEHAGKCLKMSESGGKFCMEQIAVAVQVCVQQFHVARCRHQLPERVPEREGGAVPTVDVHASDQRVGRDNRGKGVQNCRS